MHETAITDQAWMFTCHLCGHQWSVVYKVHSVQGFDGDELELWRRDGQPSMAPDAGVPCPQCDEKLRIDASVRTGQRQPTDSGG